MKKTILILLLVSNLAACSVERQIAKQCDVAATFIDQKEGSIIVCIKCDSIKSNLIKRIENKYKK